MPIIFMEWVNLPNNPEACPEFREWVTNFYQAGYIPTNTREYNKKYLQKDIFRLNSVKNTNFGLYNKKSFLEDLKKKNS